MGDQNLLSRAPPCSGRQVKLLVLLHLQSLAPTPVSRWVDVRQAAGRKNNCRINDEKHVVATPLSGIRVGKRKLFTSLPTSEYS
jgi:hypothetical protein